MVVQDLKLMRLLVGPLVGKSYHTKEKDGYSLPTNNHINWIWMSKKIGLNYTLGIVNKERNVFPNLCISVFVAT